jgi:hypothetical protein
MRFTVDLEGLDALERAAVDAERALERDLARASLEAAKAGVEEAQTHHRYQDRTHHLTATSGPVVDGDDAEMTWPMPYAGYVDAGRFNFTNVARARATAVLQKGAETAAVAFGRKVST